MKKKKAKFAYKVIFERLSQKWSKMMMKIEKILNRNIEFKQKNIKDNS